MTTWKQHIADWKDCKRCPLNATRSRIVLGRGQLPCDVMLVGEAPGESEDTLGLPFKGPAGQLLDCDLQSSPGIVQRAGLIERGLRLAFVNLLGCIPLAEDGQKVEGGPDDDHVRACSPRVIELLEMGQPKLIVCVGALSRDWLDPKLLSSIKWDRSVPRVHIDHPARILRAPWAQRSMMVQRAVVTLKRVVGEVFGDA